VLTWFEEVARTRLAPDGVILVIQTRWHEADLVGSILDSVGQDQWEVLSLSAVAEADDPLGRAPGKALWPARYPDRPRPRTLVECTEAETSRSRG
jgi:hypothetical protein